MLLGRKVYSKGLGVILLYRDLSVQGEEDAVEVGAEHRAWRSNRPGPLTGLSGASHRLHLL